MIPKIDRTARRETRDLIRKADFGRLTDFEKLQLFLKVRPRSKKSASKFLGAFALQLTGFALVAFMLFLIAVAICVFGVCIPNDAFVNNELRLWAESTNPVLVHLIVGTLISSLAFFCMFGELNKRLQTISRRFPIVDRSKRRFVIQRSIFTACIVLFAIFTFHSITSAQLSGLVLCGLTAFQTLFVLSVVVAAGEKFGFDFLIMFVFAVFVVPLFTVPFFGGIKPICFGYPHPLVDADLIWIRDVCFTLLFPSTWCAQTGSDGPTWILILQVCSMALVIVHGVLVFFRLVRVVDETYEDEIRFDEDCSIATATKTSLSIAATNQAIEVEPDQLESAVMERIAVLDAPDKIDRFWSSPFVSKWISVSNRLKPLPVEQATNQSRKANMQTTVQPLFGKAIDKWMKYSLLTLGASATVTVILVWIGGCFSARDSDYPQLLALLFCTMLAVIPSIVGLSLSGCSRHRTFTHFPIGIRETSQRFFGASFRVWVVCGLLLACMNLIFCSFYDFSAFEVVSFVMRPLVIGFSAAMMVQIIPFIFLVCIKGVARYFHLIAVAFFVLFWIVAVRESLATLDEIFPFQNSCEVSALVLLLLTLGFYAPVRFAFNASLTDSDHQPLGQT